MFKDPDKQKAYARKWRKANLARMAAHLRNWRLKNPERAAELRINWAKDNPGKLRTYKRRWEKKNPDKVAAQKKRSRQRNADKIRLKNRRYQQENKAKVKGWRDKHRAKNPDKARAAGRIHRANRRGLMAGPGISPNIVETLMVAQHHTCVYCPADLRNGHHIDHRTPLSRGGRHEDSNVQLTCAACNLAKFTRTHDEFVALLAK